MVSFVENVSYSHALATHGMRPSHTVKLTDTPDKWRLLAPNSFRFFTLHTTFRTSVTIAVTHNDCLYHKYNNFSLRFIQVIPMLMHLCMFFLQEYLQNAGCCCHCLGRMYHPVFTAWKVRLSTQHCPYTDTHTGKSDKCHWILLKWKIFPVFFRWVTHWCSCRFRLIQSDP